MTTVIHIRRKNRDFLKTDIYEFWNFIRLNEHLNEHLNDASNEMLDTK